MIRLLYRYIRKSSFIILSMVSIIMFLNILIGSVQAATKSMIEVNNQLTSNYIGLAFNDDINSSEMFDIIEKIKSIDNIVLKYYMQDGFSESITSEGIYFNGEFSTEYNLIEGRFFKKEDFYGKENLAVVGKDVLKYLIEENGEKYIIRGMEKYKVIGIIGNENRKSRYNNLVLYNLNSILDNTKLLDTTTWWLDSKKYSQNELKEKINQLSKENKIIPTDQIITYPNPLKSAIKLSKNFIFSFILIIICIFITLIRATLLWLESIALEIGIRKSYGASNLNVFLEITKRYIIISLLSTLLSIIIQNLMYELNFVNFISFKVNYEVLLLSLGVTIFIGVVFIVITTYKLNKMQLNNLLRGK